MGEMGREKKGDKDRVRMEREGWEGKEPYERRERFAVF